MAQYDIRSTDGSEISGQVAQWLQGPLPLYAKPGLADKVRDFLEMLFPEVFVTGKPRAHNTTVVIRLEEDAVAAVQVPPTSPSDVAA